MKLDSIENRSTGVLIKKHRQLKKMTQHELGKKLKRSQADVSRMEAGDYVPGDTETIKKLEEILDIPNGILVYLIDSRRERGSLSRSYPLINGILNETLRMMNGDELAMTFSRVEQRLALFREDKQELAYNLIAFFVNQLDLKSDPENGLRPLIHYFAEWNRAIETWKGASSPGTTYVLPGKVPNTGLNAEPDTKSNEK